MGRRQVRQKIIDGIVRRFKEGQIITVRDLWEIKLCDHTLDFMKILRELADEGIIIKRVKIPGQTGQYVVQKDIQIRVGPVSKGHDEKDICRCRHCPKLKTTKSPCPNCQKNGGICCRCNGLGWHYADGSPFIKNTIKPENEDIEGVTNK